MADLIILIGLPGSGKSSWAQNYKKVLAFEGDCWEICSSDATRKELYGDESIQGNPNTVFTHLHNKVKNYLNNHINVIYDATNINRKNRKSIINIGKSIPDTKVHAYILWAPLEICIQRDAERSRNVGQEVIDRMIRRWETPWFDEGFETIKLIPTYNSEYDLLDYTDKCWKDMNIEHDNPHHQLGIQYHCKEAYDRAYWYCYPKIVQIAAKWHDIGKPYTKFYKKDSEGNVIPHAHYYNHDNVGGYMSLGIRELEFLDYRDSIHIIQFSWLISNHMQPFFNSNYYNSLNGADREYIDQLHKCDLEAH